MLRNSYYYYNNPIPYNMFYRPAPVYPNIETQCIDNSTKPIEESIKSIDKNEMHSEESAKTNDTQESYNTTVNEKSQSFFRDIFSINKEKDKEVISLFGFSLHIDDIIIIGLAIFIYIESNKIDYVLLIILGLMLFDISFDTFKNMNIIKQLFNPS